MNRLNPFSNADTKLISFFPPHEVFYRQIQEESFKRFLISDATTDKGQQAIANFYDVYDEWTTLSHSSDRINNYYKLLHLVKTKSKKDNIWISFFEGLHRHATTIACLLCTKFDYENNIIKPGSLLLEDIKKADIPYFKNPGYGPKECLRLIFNSNIEALMLTLLFTCQAYIPKQLDGEIQSIMENLNTHSLWVLINKIDSARKTVPKSLWLFLSSIMTLSKKRNNPNVRSQWLDTDTFTYQEQITIQK
jgi:hypothetical protein